MNEAEQITDNLEEKNVAVVIGGAHVPLIIKEYKGKRKLYEIKPNALD